MFLHGNEKLKSFFASAAENGKMAHAYILEGGRGSGKHTLARRLACLLACRSFLERPCMMCESCRKIAEGISPDVIEIGLLDDKKTIGVEQMRELRSSVFVKPTEEDVKVYIIGNAETMTVQAQNVFLKVLEEPPRGVYFLMLCENVSNILPTVRSRAPSLKMQIFTDGELTDYLLANNPKARSLNESDPDELKLIVRIAEGKIGEAERLLADSKGDKSQSKHDKAKTLIEMSSENVKYSELLTFVQKMGKSRDDIADILLYASYAVRDLMAIKRGGENAPLLFYSDFEYAEGVASMFTSAGIMALYGVVCDAYDDLLANLNSNNTLDYVAVSLRKAASI